MKNIFARNLLTGVFGDEGLTADKIKDFIQNNKDDENVKGLLNELRADNTFIESYLNENENGKTLAQKLFDSKVGKAVSKYEANFKENKLPEMLKEEREKIRKELNPKETEEQKLIREQKERIDALEMKAKRSELKAQAIDLLQEFDLPFAKLVDNFLGEDQESTVNKIQAFKEVWDSNLDKAVEQRLAKNNGRSPNNDGKKNEGSLEEKLGQAKRSGNMLEVIKIKNQMSEQKNG